MDTDVKNPKVTVFMTVYNGEMFLCSAIESILAQTFGDFEFLILDDGSTDKTSEILRSFSDPRIKIITHTVNKGLVKSRNFGLENARGTYIAIVDADDESLPERFEKQVEFLDTHPEIGAAGSWIRTIGENAGYVNKYYESPDMIKANLLFYTSLAQPSVMLRKSIFDAHRLRYDKANEHCEDYGLWIELSRVSKLANIPEVLLQYRVHKKGYSKEHHDLGFADAMKLREKQLLNLGLHPGEEERRLHNSFKSTVDEPTALFIAKEENWLQKIVSANEKTKRYDENALHAVIYERWRTVCGMNAKEGLIVWNKFHTSPLFALGGAKKYFDSLKIFVKCVLRK